MPNFLVAEARLVIRHDWLQPLLTVSVTGLLTVSLVLVKVSVLDISTTKVQPVLDLPTLGGDFDSSIDGTTLLLIGSLEGRTPLKVATDGASAFEIVGWTQAS